MDGISQAVSSAALVIKPRAEAGEAPLDAVNDVLLTAEPVVTHEKKWSPNNFANNLEEANLVTATIKDTSLKYSYKERLKAYSSIYKMAAKGKLAGMTSDDEKHFSKALFKSDIGVRAAKTQQDSMTAHLAAQDRGENSAIARLKFVSELSEVDQQTNFAVNENGFDMAGNRQYADFDSYCNQLVANAMYEYTWASKEIDKGNPIGNDVKSNASETAQALRDIDSSTLGRDWGRYIVSLLDTNKASVPTLDSSTSSASQSFSPGMPLSYNPGNFLQLLA